MAGAIAPASLYSVKLKKRPLGRSLWVQSLLRRLGFCFGEAGSLEEVQETREDPVPLGRAIGEIRQDIPASLWVGDLFDVSELLLTGFSLGPLFALFLCLQMPIFLQDVTPDAVVDLIQAEDWGVVVEFKHSEQPRAILDTVYSRESAEKDCPVNFQRQTEAGKGDICQQPLVKVEQTLLDLCDPQALVEWRDRYFVEEPDGVIEIFW